MSTRVVVVPPVPALLPEHASITDPVAELLLAEAGHRGDVASGPGGAGDAVLVLANGSARRGEESPGGADDRAPAFDAGVEKALTDCDGAALRCLDAELGAALMASGTCRLREVGRLLEHGAWTARVLYSGDPFGVQYWVAVLARG